MLGNLLSGGAAELVKGVGGVIDNLHTSKEEKLEAEQKVKELIASYEVQMEKDIAERKGVSVEEIGKDDEVQDYLAQQRKELRKKYVE